MTQAVIQTTVTGLQGRPIATTAPTANQALTWTGSAWGTAGPFLPTAGGTVTNSIRYTYASPQNIWTDTATANTTGGLWREYVSGGNWVWQSNTAPAGDFSAAANVLTLSANGNVGVGAGLSCGANIFATGNITTTSGNFSTTNGGVSAFNITALNATLPCGANNSQIQPVAGGWRWVNNNGNYVFQHNPAVDPIYLFFGPAGNLCTINTAGGMSILGTLTQGSDEVSKTNINPVTQGISLVRQLIPKSFAWKTTPNETQWGFIAQDVQGVIPVAVGETQVVDVGTSTPAPATLTLDINAILAAVTFAVKQIDERLTAVEAHDGITPPAAQLA